MTRWQMTMLVGGIMLATGIMGRMSGPVGPATRAYDLIMIIVGGVLSVLGYWKSRK